MTYGRATGRVPRAEPAEVGKTNARLAVLGRTATRAPHARPCVGARATVGLCMGTRSSVHGRVFVESPRFAIFGLFICGFPSFLGYFFHTSLEQILGRKLGFSVAPINSDREKLD